MSPLLLLCASAPALLAAELPDALRREEAPPQKPAHWAFVLFEDPADSEDCPPEAALRGACIEEVRFATLDAEDRSLATARGRANLSRLQERLWVDLAYRWAREDDVLASTIIATGVQTLPSPADTWDRWKGRAAYDALADKSAFLGPEAWIGMMGEGDPAFPILRYRVSQGEQRPPMSVLAGRFALRLGAGGQPFDFELMDADPIDSKPFLEQMYPYQTHSQTEAPHPLGFFDLPNGEGRAQPVPALQLPVDSYEAVTRAAELRFRQFSTQLSVQIAQYALVDYTVNHMRVMAALTAMIYPPGWGAAGLNGGRGLVAASLGETDLVADQATRLEGPAYALRDGFALNVAAIPYPIVAEWVTERLASHPPTQDRRRAIAAHLRQDLDGLLRPESLAPEMLDPRGLAAWLAASANPGADLDLLQDTALRLVLEAQLADATGEEALAAAETDLLLRQVWQASAGAFDASEGVRLPPVAVTAAVTGHWSAVLSRHGVAPQPIAQGLGAIDPSAICTTQDGVAALEEPSIGAVRLDLLVIAPDKAQATAAETLWAARDQLPFVALDRPSYNPPEVTRLVGLPGGERAIYRIRWQIWSGWHLLWTPEDVAGAPPRLGLRTAAICADTVLAPPTLVPTLLRAALLDGELRGVEPVPLFGAPKEATASPDPAEVRYLQDRLLAPFAARAKKQGDLVAVVGDLGPGRRGPPTLQLIPRSPYARHRRGFAESAARTALWARAFGPDTPPASSTLVFPAWRPGEAVNTQSAHPRWFRNRVANVNFTSGLGAFPYRDAVYACNTAISSPSYVADCAVDPNPNQTRTEGLALDVAALTTWWFWDHPRLGLDGGLQIALEASHPGQPYRAEAAPVWAEEGPDFSFLYRPTGGLVGGLRYAPVAWPLRTPRGLLLWGAEQKDGSSRLRRPEVGLRGAFLIGPGFNGAEGTASVELWAALSARSTRSPYAHLTPYNPRQMYGFFIRPSFTFPFADPADSAERYVLQRSQQLLIGVRGHWDIQGKLPEAPKAE